MAHIPRSAIALTALAFAANIPAGYVRAQYEKFSLAWFTAIHITVPPIIVARRMLKLPRVAIPMNIAAAVCGQYVGGKLESSQPTQEQSQQQSK
eukprot:m.345547 g.345547  ORF g.345547 m.345547 type:complete len:94 (+) comp26669_c0_seq1:424-705(+)